ncbi:hypothetical protein SEA_PEPPERWOOD_195 [Streptomyces phage Pepperwood]|nr:hypothetical protein SEA_PEPPERWOOD_195 [Streptomyces phage Pepperwood]
MGESALTTSRDTPENEKRCHVFPFVVVSSTLVEQTGRVNPYAKRAPKGPSATSGCSCCTDSHPNGTETDIDRMSIEMPLHPS